MPKKDRKSKKDKHDKKDKKDKSDKNDKKSKGKHRMDIANKHKKGRGKGKTKQDKNWDRYFAEFNETLKPKGIYMRDVEGDGNCLFRSIADFIEGDEDTHSKYRELAVEYITKHKEYFALFLEEDENMDEYIKDMSESGTWGGHFELVALSSVIGAKFCLYMKDKNPVVIKSSEKDMKNAKIVHLAYHVDEHYSCIRKLGDEDKTPAVDIPLPFDDETESSSSSSDGESDEDSTEGSDKEVAALAKEVEKLHVKDKKNKAKEKEKEKGKGKEKEEEQQKGKKKGKR
jgi:OTU domain-containing protein 3